MRSTLYLMPPPSSPVETGISFNTGGTKENPVWVELARLGIAYSAGTALFLATGEAVFKYMCRVVFYPRANPIDAIFQMRLKSYYYDDNGQRVYNTSWPIADSNPGYLGVIGVNIMAQVDALVKDTNFGRGHYVLAEVSGAGTMFGAQIEMQ